MTTQSIGARNILEGMTNWQGVCTLAMAMTNGGFYDEPARAGLAYMADQSIGGRDWDVVGDPVHDVENGFGSHLGFEEAQTARLWWKSATSGATIEATSVGGGWWALTFEGTENEGESSYWHDFLVAVEPATVTVGQAPKSAELLEGIGRQADFAKEQGSEDRYSGLMALAAQLA